MDTNGNYIRNQFCSYKIALKLKELGFNEECLGYFRNNTKSFHLGEDTRVQKDSILAPLWQQVIVWFSEKHSIDLHINRGGIRDNWYIGWRKFGYSYNHGDYSKPFKSYHEAREQAILEAIEYIKTH